jgi:hypothetical protein
MKKNDPVAWPEIVFVGNERHRSNLVRSAVKSGILRPIAPKIYTSNAKDSLEEIIKRNRYQILGYLFPQGVISHRSALEGGISSDGVVFLTFKYTKNVDLPGLRIRLMKGPGPDPADMPFLENLYISSRARAFLENLQLGRNRTGLLKTVSKKQLEERLNQMIRTYGIEELNKVRDQARMIAERLKMEEEFSELDNMIGAFLGTRPDTLIESESGRSRALKQPFDAVRIELFATLTACLQQRDLPIRKSQITSPQARINQSFFESYFSNYIEGTRFEVEEAKKIIFENKIFSVRPEDSHDVLSTFQIVSNPDWMETTPNSFEQFVEILQHRHFLLMEARPGTMPGKFKEISNRVGNTVFVKPDEVFGTLAKGFDFYLQLNGGLAKAIFLMFLVSEVHLFVDGNGRIARILMNAELDAAGQSRIIIPNVYRDDYLLALRKFSRKLDPDPYVRMLLLAQKYTAGISYEDYYQALAMFHATNAFQEPSEAKLKIPDNIL